MKVIRKADTLRLIATTANLSVNSFLTIIRLVTNLPASLGV